MCSYNMVLIQRLALVEGGGTIEGFHCIGYLAVLIYWDKFAV